MATWQDHLDNLDALAVQSANKALDYYDGDQLGWLESLLDGNNSDTSNELVCPSNRAGGIKNWRDRGVYPWYTNLTKKIVDRSALSYNKAPERGVVVNKEPNDDGTADYLEILRNGEFEAVMDSADSVSRLLKNAIILAQPVEVVNGEDKIMFDVLHRGNADVDYDFQNGTIKSLMYKSAGSSAKSNVLYHFWDSVEVIDIEIIDSQPIIAGRESHGYKIIPAAVLWDTYKPRAGFWPKDAWTELIRLNEGTNLFHTEVKFNERFQAFGALFTNGIIPEGTVIGPDANVELGTTATGEALFVEYRTPDINLEKFTNWLKDFEADIADNWGVNLRVAGGGSADSGFKLIVEEIWNLETRNDRLKAATQFERDMYQVVLAISEDQGLGLPSNSDLLVKFPKPSLPVNVKEDWDIRKEKIATDFISKEDGWKEEDPDITPEEIDKRKERIAADKVVLGPTFQGVISEV